MSTQDEHMNLVVLAGRVATDPEVRMRLTGALQRRYWESPDGRRSRLELVADQITVGRTRQLDDPDRSQGPEMGL